MHAPADQVVIIVHQEAGGYWAEIEGIPGFSAADSTLPGLLHRMAFAIADTGVR